MDTRKKKILAGIGVLFVVFACSLFHVGITIILFLMWLDVFILRRFFHLGLFGVETFTVAVIFLGLSFGPVIGALGGLFLPLVFGTVLLVREAAKEKQILSAPTLIDPVNGVVGGVTGLVGLMGDPFLAVGAGVLAKIILFPIVLHFTIAEVGGIFIRTVTNFINAVLILVIFFALGPLFFF